MVIFHSYVGLPEGNKPSRSRLCSKKVTIASFAQASERALVYQIVGAASWAAGGESLASAGGLKYFNGKQLCRLGTPIQKP